MKANGWQVKKQKYKHSFGENTLKVLRSYLGDEWKKGGDYGKYMQDVTYFCSLSGVRITLLDTLLCAWQLYFVWRRTSLHCKCGIKIKSCSKGERWLVSLHLHPAYLISTTGG